MCKWDTNSSEALLLEAIQRVLNAFCVTSVKQPQSDFLIIFYLWITESHRMVGVGRDLCGSSSPTPLPRQGHLQQAAQDLVQAGLEYLQRRRIHNLSRQPLTGISANSQPESKEPGLGDSFLRMTAGGTDPTSLAKNIFAVSVSLHLTVIQFFDYF